MRFRRKEAAVDPVEAGEVGEVGEEQEVEAPAGVGPHDEHDVDLETHPGIDLGSLVITPGEEMELRLEVDEQTGEIGAVLLVGEDGAMELRAFAASRGGGSWADLRREIGAEIARMGGTATPQEGTFGDELLCLVPVQTPDGQQATQASRVIGHEGSTWLLRATLLGQPAIDAELAARWEDAFRQVVVRRGREARPPGTPLALRLPPEARRAE